MPFRLQGSVIEIFRYSLEWTEKNGVTQTYCEPTMKLIETMKNRLIERGISDFVVKELDTTDYQWIDGIDIGKKHSMQDAIAIYKMGQAAYLETINASSDEDYMVDLDYRVSMLELGL